MRTPLAALALAATLAAADARAAVDPSASVVVRDLGVIEGNAAGKPLDLQVITDRPYEAGPILDEYTFSFVGGAGRVKLQGTSDATPGTFPPFSLLVTVIREGEPGIFIGDLFDADLVPIVRPGNYSIAWIGNASGPGLYDLGIRATFLTPVPAALPLLGTALAGLAVMLRRRQRAT